MQAVPCMYDLLLDQDDSSIEFDRKLHVTETGLEITNET